MGGVLALVGAVALVATLVLLYFASSRALASDPRPASSYEEAVKRIATLKARDGANISRPSIVMDHGSQVATAVVLFHGFTNNPEQFEQLGKDYFAAGYNVLIPRLPEHGQKDLLTRDLTKITSSRLASATDEAVDIAAGLGKKVEVVGLSGGGTMAALAAHDREEVSTAVIMSPLFGVDMLPAFVVKPLVAWSRVLPDIFMWWDPRVKENHIPADAYPRYSLKSISAFFEVGFDFMRREPTRKSRLDRVVLITNAADDSIDEGLAKDAITKELKPIAGDYQEFEFPRANGYAHDLIDPNGLNAKSIDDIYGAIYPYLGLTPSSSATTATPQP